MRGVRNTILTVLIAMACIVGFMLFQFACIDFFIQIGWQPRPSMLKNGINTWGMYAIYILASCIFPAVMEELIFRFGVFGILRKYIRRMWVAVIVSAMIFSAYHMNIGQTVYQFIMGVIFACIYLKTSNILYPMLAHFINNFFIVTYTFIAGSDYLAYSWDFASISAMIVLAIGGMSVIMRLVQSLEKENHERIIKRFGL
jgi:membrane protease YdiL (CAAX protease family)